MWHRKSDTNNVNNSIARSFTIRSNKNSTGKGGGALTSTNANVKGGSAAAARRSRDPPQAMNLAAFIRSVVAGSKEDLTEREECDGLASSHESGESDASTQSDDGYNHCDGSSDDNLHDLMVNTVCDMLERCAHVSSGEEGPAERKGGRESRRHDRRKVRKTETIEVVCAEVGSSDDDEAAEMDSLAGTSRSHKATLSPQTSWIDAGSPSSSFAGATLSSRAEERPDIVTTSPTSGKESLSVSTRSGRLPALLLQRSALSVAHQVRHPRSERARRTASSSAAASGASADESSAISVSPSMAAATRRRESQRLLLRRSLSGRLTRKTAPDGASHITLLPHTRSARASHSKRSRSETKKEPKGTPRDHAEEVVIRKAIGSANRRYLIPRMNRLQHYSLHVVLDLDETLVSARNGPILVRPYVGHLIQTLMELRCEIILWTAGIPQYVAGIIAGLTMAIQGLSAEVCEQERPPWLHHLIQRNDRWYDEDKVCVKDLKLLGRPMDRVLIIENNPAAVQLQVSNAVLVQDYIVENYNDRSLEVVSRVVSRCARSIEPVSSSLASDPELLFVEFDLEGEHSVDGKPIRPVEYGLRYSPPGSKERVHAGESPCSIIEKE